MEWLRKLWSDWNWRQADDAVRNAGRKLMGHSEETFNKFFLISDRTEALDHGNLLLDDIMNSGKGETESEDEEPRKKRRKVGTSKGKENAEDSECQVLRQSRTEHPEESDLPCEYNEQKVSQQETKKSAHTFTQKEREKMREFIRKGRDEEN